MKRILVLPFLLLLISGCLNAKEETIDDSEPFNGKSLQEVMDYYEDDAVVLNNIKQHNLFIYKIADQKYGIQNYKSQNGSFTFDGFNNSYNKGIDSNEQITFTRFVNISRFNDKEEGRFLFGYVNQKNIDQVTVVYKRMESCDRIEDTLKVSNQTFFLFVPNNDDYEVVQVLPSSNSKSKS